MKKSLLNSVLVSVAVSALLISATAGADQASNQAVCSNLYAAQTLATVEVQSYQIRDYNNVSTTYMRLLLGNIRNLAQRAIDLGAQPSQALYGITSQADYEIQDSYHYDNYQISTAARVFTQIASNASQAAIENGCQQ